MRSRPFTGLHSTSVLLQESGYSASPKLLNLLILGCSHSYASQIDSRMIFWPEKGKFLTGVDIEYFLLIKTTPKETQLIFHT